MDNKITEAKELKSHIEIKTSKTKGVIMLIISTLFVMCCAHILKTSFDYAIGFLLKAVALFGVLFFGAGAIAGFILLIKSKTFLIINSEGITINSLLKPSIFIPWNEIVGFSSYSFGTIEIEVLNHERIYQKANFLTKGLIKFTQQFEMAPLTIGNQHLDIKHDALLEVLELALIKHKPQS